MKSFCKITFSSFPGRLLPAKISIHEAIQVEPSSSEWKSLSDPSTLTRMQFRISSVTIQQLRMECPSIRKYARKRVWTFKKIIQDSLITELIPNGTPGISRFTASRPVPDYNKDFAEITSSRACSCCIVHTGSCMEGENFMGCAQRMIASSPDKWPLFS